MPGKPGGGKTHRQRSSFPSRVLFALSSMSRLFARFSLTGWGPGCRSSDPGLGCFLPSLRSPTEPQSVPARLRGHSTARTGCACLKRTEASRLRVREAPHVRQPRVLPGIAFAYRFAPRRCAHSHDLITNGARSGEESQSPFRALGKGWPVWSSYSRCGKAEQQKGWREASDVPEGGQKPQRVGKSRNNLK